MPSGVDHNFHGAAVHGSRSQLLHNATTLNSGLIGEWA